jgi:predicted exporter
MNEPVVPVDPARRARVRRTVWVLVVVAVALYATMLWSGMRP